MNDQRREVYAQRREFMKAVDVMQIVADMRAEVTEQMVNLRIPEKAYAEQWQSAELAEDVRRLLNIDLPIVEWAREEGIDESGIRDRIERAADNYMAAKAANFGPDLMRFVEKSLLLQVLDAVWKEHLLALDHLRQGIVLRAYGQRDPLNEYKSEAFTLFNAMLDELKERVTMLLSRADVGPEAPRQMEFASSIGETFESHPDPASLSGVPETGLAIDVEPPRILNAPVRTASVDPEIPATWANSPRNAPCPCGSGKKFKHCHGRNV
jgi:preprotein translocase subunit SecA